MQVQRFEGHGPIPQKRRRDRAIDVQGVWLGTMVVLAGPRHHCRQFGAGPHRIAARNPAARDRVRRVVIVASSVRFANCVRNTQIRYAKVLEVAPGPGYFAIELAKLGVYQIVGLDISKTFVKIAQCNAARAGARAEFRLGSASDMPLESNQFDFLFCKPGGRALIVDLRRDASLASINKEVAHMGLGFFNAWFTRLAFRFMLLKRACTKSDFEQLLAQTPFRSADIQENGIGLDIWLQK